MARLRLGLDLRLYGAEHSGLGRYAEEILYILSARSQELDLVGFVSSSAASRTIAGLGVKTIIAPYRPYSAREQIFFPPIIKNAGVDLMHFLHFNAPLAYRGPYVVTIHDLIMHHFPWRLASRRSLLVFLIKHLGYRLAVSAVIRRARAVIAVSHFTAEDILNYYPRAAGRLIIIPEPTPSFAERQLYPVRNNNSAPQSGAWFTPWEQSTRGFKYPARISNGIYNDKNVILFYNIRQPYVLIVGNFYPHKNIDAVIRAWRRLYISSKRQLVLVGRLDSFAKRLLNTARELRLAGGGNDSPIRFLGFVSDDDLWKLYCMSEYYLIPSLWEGVGLTGLEALAAERPVISSAHGALPETFEGRATYIPVENEERIYKALYEIFRSPIKRSNHMPANTVTREQAAESLMACYHQALQGSP